MGLLRALAGYFGRTAKSITTAAPFHIVEGLEPRRLLSSVLVKDIYPGKDVVGDVQMLTIGSTLYFSASGGVHGIELWKSNGKTKGTQLVRDISPGRADSNPRDFVNFEGLLFFTADTPGAGRELWRSDGTTAGTFLVKDINLGPDSSNITEMTQVGEQLFFAARDSSHGIELWKTNGRSKGTVLVSDIVPGGDSFGHQFDSSPNGLVNWNGVLFFQARYNPYYYDTVVYKSDGTASGTTPTKIRYYPTKDALFLDRHSHTFLSEVSYYIAKTDGYSTSVETVPLRPRGNRGPITAIAEGIMYFAGNDGLWRTDGTVNGTFRLCRGAVYNLRAAGSKLLFARLNPPISFPLWVTDGTIAGTQVVERRADGVIGDEEISNLINVGGTFYFIQLDTLRRLNSTLTSMSEPLNSHDLFFEAPLASIGDRLFCTSTGDSGQLGLFRYIADD